MAEPGANPGRGAFIYYSNRNSPGRWGPLRRPAMPTVVVLLILVGWVAFQRAAGPGRPDVARPRQAATGLIAGPGVAGYTGTLHSETRGDIQVYFLAPDRFLARERLTGDVYAVDGQTVWGYSPGYNRGDLTVNSPHPSAPYNVQFPVPGRVFDAPLVHTLEPDYAVLPAGQDRVAGRRTDVYRLVPRPGPRVRSEVWIWVDTATGLVLQRQTGAQGRPTGAREGFTDIVFVPPDPRRFEPRFPPGTAVVREIYADLPTLAAHAGFPLPEPPGLPERWRLGQASLTEYPPGPGDRKVVAWYYFADGETALAVTLTTPPRPHREDGETVVLVPGVTGVFFAREVTGWPVLAWVVDRIAYSLSGPGLARAQLVTMARGLLAAR